MTTIVADRKGMAADSLTSWGAVGYHASKIGVVGDAIVGCAGNATDAARFFEWWASDRKEPWTAKKAFQALVLTDKGMWLYGKKGLVDKIADPYMAIGSGFGIALGAMDTMLTLGHEPDVRLAVEIACQRSPESGSPVEYVSLKQIRKKK